MHLQERYCNRKLSRSVLLKRPA